MPEQIKSLLKFIRDGRRAVTRHWRLGAGVFGAVLALTVVGVFCLPRNYSSEAKLFVRPGRNMVLDPTASGGGPVVSVLDTRESELNSLLEILNNRSLLDRVVDALGAGNVLRGRLPAGDLVTGAQDQSPNSPGEKREPGVIAEESSRSRVHQRAVAKLEKNVKIFVPKKTSTIVVRGQAESPELAQRIVGTLVSLYLDEHLRVYHTAGSYQFFVEQSDLWDKNWRDAVQKLNGVKDQWGISTIEGKRKLLQEQIADVEMKHSAGQSELAAAESRVASIQARRAELAPDVRTQSAETANPVADGMRQEFYKLQTKEEELAAKMGDGNPQLVILRDQMAHLKTIMEAQPPVRQQPTMGVNPARQSLELDLLREQAQVDAIRGRETKLVEMREQLRGQLKELNAQDAQLAALQHEVDSAEGRFRAYNDKREQARINQQLDQDRISNLSIVQPASYVAQTSGGKRSLLLALGLIVAALGGVAVTLAAEFLNPLFNSAADIEQRLQLPVFGPLSLSRGKELAGAELSSAL